MVVIHVHVNVKPERVEEFISATRKNAEYSLKETGVVRFDIVQEEGNPNRLILIEIYKNQTSANAHKDTEHYQVWRNTVSDMMDDPRQSIRYKMIFPDVA